MHGDLSLESTVYLSNSVFILRLRCTIRINFLLVTLLLYISGTITDKVIKNIKNVTGCRDTRTAKSKETREGWSNITVMYTTPLQRSSSIYVYNEKRYVGGLYTSLLCSTIPPLFPYFLPFWYPYILLHF